MFLSKVLFKLHKQSINLGAEIVEIAENLCVQYKTIKAEMLTARKRPNWWIWGNTPEEEKYFTDKMNAIDKEYKRAKCMQKRLNRLCLYIKLLNYSKLLVKS